jgi:hypothetical protein
MSWANYEKNLMMASLAETCSSAWQICELRKVCVNSDGRIYTRVETLQTHRDAAT